MSTVVELLEEIKSQVSQVSSSSKDEVKVMMAMLNDTSYEVGVYDNNGLKETYNPAKDYRNMLTNVIVGSTKISKEEASSLVENYEVTKSDASSMVNVSKEFVNTYISTGRKLPFGGREKSNIAISQKEVKESVKRYPKLNDSGEYETMETPIPAHVSARLHASCPDWLK